MTALAWPGLFRRLAMRSPVILAGAALLAGALRFLPLLPGSLLWLSLLVAAAWRVPASRPWVAGFLVPAILLLGVDFHVATYLLEPVLCLVPASLLWLQPLLEPVGRRMATRLSGLPSTAAVIPLVLLALAVGLLRDRVPPIRAMRQVRAVFRSGAELLLSRAPGGATIGCLTYDELGSSYADIRRRPLGERVELHKTMNPAQLEKFLALRGRPDLKVVSVTEAESSAGTVFLLALNGEEEELLERVAGAARFARFSAGKAVVAIYVISGQ